MNRKCSQLRRKRRTRRRKWMQRERREEKGRLRLREERGRTSKRTQQVSATQLMGRDGNKAWSKFLAREIVKDLSLVKGNTTSQLLPFA